MVCFNYSWFIQSTYYILNIILCSKFLRSQSLVFPINKSGLSSDTAKHSNVLSLIENFSSYHLHSMQSCKWYSAIILHLDGGPILFLWLVYCSSIKEIFHKANFVFLHLICWSNDSIKHLWNQIMLRKNWLACLRVLY